MSSRRRVLPDVCCSDGQTQANVTIYRSGHSTRTNRCATLFSRLGASLSVVAFAGYCHSYVWNITRTTPTTITTPTTTTTTVTGYCIIEKNSPVCLCSEKKGETLRCNRRWYSTSRSEIVFQKTMRVSRRRDWSERTIFFSANTCRCTFFLTFSNLFAA